jgi:hypothetical protein
VQRVRLVDHEHLALADLEQRRRLLLSASDRGRDEVGGCTYLDGAVGQVAEPFEDAPIHLGDGRLTGARVAQKEPIEGQHV